MAEFPVSQPGPVKVPYLLKKREMVSVSVLGVGGERTSHELTHSHDISQSTQASVPGLVGPSC
jgi:hypothetical protein